MLQFVLAWYVAIAPEDMADPAKLYVMENVVKENLPHLAICFQKHLYVMLRLCPDPPFVLFQVSPATLPTQPIALSWRASPRGSARQSWTQAPDPSRSQLT